MAADVQETSSLYNRGETKLGGLLILLRIVSMTVLLGCQSFSSG